MLKREKTSIVMAKQKLFSAGFIHELCNNLKLYWNDILRHWVVWCCSRDPRDASRKVFFSCITESFEKVYKLFSEAAPKAEAWWKFARRVKFGPFHLFNKLKIEFGIWRGSKSLNFVTFIINVNNFFSFFNLAKKNFFFRFKFLIIFSCFSINYYTKNSFLIDSNCMLLNCYMVNLTSIIC